MKKNLLLTILSLTFLAFLFFDASSGAGSAQNADRTGSPIASGNCGNCHSGGGFNTSVAVEILDDALAVNTYQPGQSYTFKVTVSASGDPAGYGFQAVALSGTDNANAGTFGEAPSGTQVSTVDNRKYFEHSQRSTENSWSVPWTAPAAGTGDIRIYAAGNAVNGGNGSGGDHPATLSSPLTLTEGTVSSTFARQSLDLQMKVYPNPVVDILNLELKGSEQGLFQLRLFDNAGKIVQSETVQVAAGRSNQQINVQDLPQGHYYLHLSNGDQGKTLSVLKQ